MIFLHSIFLTLIVISFKKLYKDSSIKVFFYPALLFKIFGGIAFGMLYIHYYTQGGDTFVLYQDAYQFYKLFQSNPKLYFSAVFQEKFHNIPNLSRPEIWQLSRAFFMVRLLSIFLIFTKGSYWLVSLYFSVISFIGLWFAADKFATYFKESKYAAVLSFLFLPSLILWSSGIHKEALAMASWGVLIGFFIEFIHKEKLHFFWLLKVCIFSPIFIFLLARLKFYYLGAFLPLAIAYILLHKTPLIKVLKTTFLQNLGMFFIWALLLLMASFSHYKLYPENFLDIVVTNHNATFFFSEPDTCIRYWKIWGKGFFSMHSEIFYFLPNIPMGIISGLFRPFLWDGRGILAKFSALEHLFFFILMIWGILYFWENYKKIKHKNLIFTGLLYCIFLATLLAMATPNFGTLVRYKIGFLPIWTFIFSIPLSIYITKNERKIKEFLIFQTKRIQSKIPI